MPIESTFSYSNAPQALLPKKKYRSTEEDDAAAGGGGTGFTLMSDPRVVRGPTRTGKNKSKSATSSAPGRRQAQAETAAEEEEAGRSHRATYQYKVEGLVRPEIDLSQFLVERAPDLAEQRRRAPKEGQTQTDKFQDRPASPEYVPRKTGVDVMTQVDDLSELFVFDLEVEPLLSVLCAKTLEQAMFELECEGELLNLREEAARCEEVRVAEEQWAAAREMQSVAAGCTKELALKALQAEARAQRQVREKVAGAEAMRQLLPALLEDVFSELVKTGERAWEDPERADLARALLPGVYRQAGAGLLLFRQAQELVDEMLLLACEGCEQACFPGEGARRHPCVLRLLCSGAGAGAQGVGSEPVSLGFVAVRDQDCVLSLDQRVAAKLVELGLGLGQEGEKEVVSVRDSLAAALGVLPEHLSPSDALDCSRLPGMLDVRLD